MKFRALNKGSPEQNQIDAGVGIALELSWAVAAMFAVCEGKKDSDGDVDRSAQATSLSLCRVGFMEAQVGREDELKGECNSPAVAEGV